MRRMGAVTVAALVAALVVPSGTAWALRPFLAATDAEIVEPGAVEIEIGTLLARNTRDQVNNTAVGVPSLVLNLGLFEHFELDIGTGVDALYTTKDDGGRTTLGSPAETSLTTKIRLFEGKEGTPSLATELSVLFPTQRRAFLPNGSRDVAFTGVAVLSGGVGSLKYFLNAGGGVSKSPKDPNDVIGSFLWMVAGELPLSKSFSVVAEVRGEAAQANLPNTTILLGLTWTAPFGVKFDAGAFAGLGRGSDNWGVTAGLTYAFEALPWLRKVDRKVQ